MLKPKPAKTAKRAFWLATHWKISLGLAVILGPLFLASYFRCSKTSDGGSTVALVDGVVGIFAGWLT